VSSHSVFSPIRLKIAPNEYRNYLRSSLACVFVPHPLPSATPSGGQFQLIVTDDGGTNWKRLSPKNLPPALPNEGAFAASGTCLVTHGKNDIWF